MSLSVSCRGINLTFLSKVPFFPPDLGSQSLTLSLSLTCSAFSTAIELTCLIESISTNNPRIEWKKIKNGVPSYVYFQNKISGKPLGKLILGKALTSQSSTAFQSNASELEAELSEWMEPLKSCFWSVKSHRGFEWGTVTSFLLSLKGDLENRAQLREPANILIFNTSRADTAEYRCEVAAIEDQRDFDEILISLAVRGMGSKCRANSLWSDWHVFLLNIFSGRITTKLCRKINFSCFKHTPFRIQCWTWRSISLCPLKYDVQSCEVSRQPFFALGAACRMS